jgi:hypothetical protein
MSYNGDRTLLPINERGLSKATGLYGSRHTKGCPLPEQLIKDVYNAMTDGLHARVIHFVAVIDLLHRHYNQETGLWDMGPELLFSAHIPGTLTRFRSAEMSALHDSWLAFNMAQRNRKKLDTVLRGYGIAIVSLCCCGGKAVAIADQKRAEDLSGEFNQLRTLADAFGTVREDIELEDIPTEALNETLRMAFIRIRENAIDVAVAQGCCACHSIPDMLVEAGINQESIDRVRKVKLHVPAGYKKTVSTPVAA